MSSGSYFGASNTAGLVERSGEIVGKVSRCPQSRELKIPIGTHLTKALEQISTSGRNFWLSNMHSLLKTECPFSSRHPSALPRS